MLHTSSSTPAQTPSLPVDALVESLHSATAHWHTHQEEVPGEASLGDLVLRMHRFNFDLWHEEDKARDPRATDVEIAATKRAIDRFNQSRVDTVEKIDQHLLHLAGQQNNAAPLNSETPGSILDRLSITALKLFHTQEEIERPDAEESHRQRNRDRLLVLEEQQNDLSQCLAELWQEVLRGTRRFKVNRPMKMYNDPSLNPAVYRSQQQNSTTR